MIRTDALRGRDLPHDVEDAIHLDARADHVCKLPLLVELLLKCTVLQSELAGGKRAFHEQAEPIEIHRLGEKVVRAVSHRLHGGLDRPVTGENNHRERGIRLDDPTQELLARNAGHLEVCDDEVDLLLFEHLECLLTVLREQHVVTVELDRLAQPGTDILLIVDDHDIKLHRRPLSSSADAARAEARGG